MSDFERELQELKHRVSESIKPSSTMADRVFHRARIRRVLTVVISVLVSGGLAVTSVAAVSVFTSSTSQGPVGPGPVQTPIGPQPVESAGNGKIVFDMGGDLYLMNQDGTGVRNLTRTRDVTELDPTWSPDGSQIAFVACQECTTSDIFVMNADGTGRTRLTEDAALDSRPAWSPDGRRIAYHSDSGNEDIWVVSIDGTDKQPLISGSGRELDPSWSPDGSQLSFQRLEGETPQSSAIFVVNSDGAGEKRLTDPSIWALRPVWSPDGETIAFSVLDRTSTTTDVYVMKSDGTGIRQVTNEPPASVFAWSPDASKLLIGRFGTRNSLHTLDLDTGNIKDVHTAGQPQTKGVYIKNASWSKTSGK